MVSKLKLIVATSIVTSIGLMSQFVEPAGASTPPVVTTGGVPAAFVEGANVASTPVVIDAGVTVTDSDSTTLASGTISLTTNYASAEDSLAFTNDGLTMGNIATTSNTGGALSLASAGAIATLAEWQAALRAVTYTNSSDAPSVAARTAEFAVNDGTDSSAAATQSISVTAANDSPIATASGGTTSWTEPTSGSTPVIIDAGLTVSDPDSATLASATMSIVTNFVSSEDAVAFTNDGLTMGNIAGSYNSGTGVYSLSSAGTTATVAQWQAALRSVTYDNSSQAPTTASRAVAVVINDGALASGATNKTVSVTATNNAPVVTTSGGAASFVEPNNVAPTPVTVDGAVTVTDPDNLTLASATVSISANLATAEDALDLIEVPATMGNIAASYTAGTGVLALTSAGATATVAQWQTALRAVTYSNSSNTPSVATRTVSFVVSDGSASSPTGTKSVTVASTNDDTVVTTSGGSATWTEGNNVASTPVTVDPGLTVTDPDSATDSSATVSITSGLVTAQDSLSFTNNGTTMGNIVGAYTAGTGVLSLSSAGATATIAQWQAALRVVKYDNSSQTPTGASRTLSFAADDGAGPGPTTTRPLTVNSTDDTPIVTTANGSAAWVEADNATSTPVVVDANITVTDADTVTFGTAVVTISTAYSSGSDTLSFTNDGASMGNITAAFNVGTGALTLNSTGSSATVANWQAALRAVTFTNSSNTPSTTARVVTFSVSDGTSSGSDTRGLTVAATNDTPVITGGGGTVAFVEGNNVTSVPVAIAPSATVTDADNGTLASASIAITANFISGQDALDLVAVPATMGNISDAYNSTTGVMALTSAGATATTAQWQAAIRAVTYTNSSQNPTTLTRTVTWSVNDGAASSATEAVSVTVAAVNDVPIVAAGSGTAAFTEGNNVASNPVAIAPALVATDADSLTLASATVSIITNFSSGQDTLAFTNDGTTMGNVTASYVGGTGVLTMTSASATATPAQWQAALRAVAYTNSSDTPSTAVRTISFVINDGTDASVASNRNVTVAAVNDSPITTTSGGQATWVEVPGGGAAPVVVDPNVAVSDLDSATLASATVSITVGFTAGQDVLAFTNNGTTMGNIAGSYVGGTGVLTMTSAGATATIAQWQAALRSVTFNNTSLNPNVVNRTVSFVANDGSTASTGATKLVSLSGANDPPIVTTTAGAASWTEANNTTSPVITIDSGVTVTDPDNTALSTGTVSITSGFQSGADVLGFVANGATMGNIAGVFNATNGVLSLTSSGGVATLANWQAALRAVSFTNTSNTPAGTSRTVTFVANDGADGSLPKTRTITVTATDDTPIAATSGGTTLWIQGDNVTVATAIDPGLTLSDPDSVGMASATAIITSGADSVNDSLTFANDGPTMGNVAGVFTGTTLTLTSAGATATPAQWQAALRAVKFTNAAAIPASGTRVVQFIANDGSTASASVTKSVSVASVNQTPIATMSGGTVTWAQGASSSPPVVLDSGVLVTDRDDPVLNTASVSISAGYAVDEDVLSFVNDGSTMGNINAFFNTISGTMTMSSSTTPTRATLAQWQAALRSVTYSNASAAPNAGARTIRVLVNDGSVNSAGVTRPLSVVPYVAPVVPPAPTPPPPPPPPPAPTPPPPPKIVCPTTSFQVPTFNSLVALILWYFCGYHGQIVKIGKARKNVLVLVPNGWAWPRTVKVIKRVF